MKLLQYLLDVTIIWTIFYVVYYLLLRKETFFQLNRLFLLSALPLGLLLPIIRLLDFSFSLGIQTQSIVQPISTAISLDMVDAPHPYLTAPKFGNDSTDSRLHHRRTIYHPANGPRAAANIHVI